MIDEIKKYLINSAKSGYASGDISSWKNEDDHSKTITNEIGEFSMNDNFFGGEPYGGRQVVFKNGSPVWIMVYYGNVLEEQEPNDIYKVLREALKNPDEELPIRGPKKLDFDDYHYSFTWSGDLEKFLGNESIVKGGNIVYFANFIGGLVDQRRGD